MTCQVDFVHKMLNACTLNNIKYVDIAFDSCLLYLETTRNLGQHYLLAPIKMKYKMSFGGNKKNVQSQYSPLYMYWYFFGRALLMS